MKKNPSFRFRFLKWCALLYGVMVLIFPSELQADYLQVIPVNSPLGTGNPSTSSTSYNAVFHRNHTFRSSIDFSRSIVPINGVVSDICFYFSVAPGSGKSWTITLRNSGSDVAGANVTIADSATEGCISAAATVSSRDRLTLKFVPSGTPADSPVTWVSYFRPDNPLASVYSFAWSRSDFDKIGGSSGNISLHGHTNHGVADDYDFAHVIPKDCVISRLFIRLTDPPGVLKDRTFRLYKNGSSTDLSCSISGAFDDDCSDTSDQVSFSAGDLAFIRHSTTLTNDSYINGSVIMATGVEGEFFLMTNLNGLSASNTMYGAVNTCNMSFTETETDCWHPAYQMTVTGMAVSLDTAPGSGKSFAFTFRNEGADGNNTCTIADTDTTCSVSAEDFVLPGSRLAIKAVPSGTPTLSDHIRISLVAFRTPIRRW